MFTGKQIREKRTNEGLSASGLAVILETTKENVYKWEGGTVPMKKRDRDKIESWLNGAAPKIESNGIDWQKKYYDLLERYNAALEKITRVSP